MPTVLHVIDAGCDETQLQVLALLRARLSDGEFRHAVCSVDGPAAARAEQHWGEKLRRAEIRGIGAAKSWSPNLPRVVRDTGATLLHAWGAKAAAACADFIELPQVVTLLDPLAAGDAARWIRSFPRQAAIAVGCQVMRTRLLSAGIEPSRLAVVRGAVDFAAINRARAANLRARLVGDAAPVLLLHGPASTGGGQTAGLWTAAVLRQIHAGLRLIMPYDAHEARRLERVAVQTRMPNLLTVPDPRMTWAELASCADVFLAPAIDDICTEPIATAMAAGLVVVGSAVRSVAELIQSGRNGLLCKPGNARSLASLALQAIEDADLRRRLTETARAQIFEVGGIRDFVDNYARLYENVLAGRNPGEGVRDPAMVA